MKIRFRIFTKISQHFVSLLSKKTYEKLRNNKSFHENFCKNQHFCEKWHGNENAVKHPNYKRQIKFRTNRSGQCSEANENN
jgi:hypothetical protein